MAAFRRSTPQSPTAQPPSPATAADRLLKVMGTSIKGALAGDIVAIHDVRVTSRRLQEWLRATDGWTGPGKSDRLSSQLKQIRKAYQQVRDLDVLIESLAAKTPRQAESPLGALLVALKRKRMTALEKVGRKMDSLNPRGLVKNLRATLKPRTTQTPAFTARFNKKVGKLTQSRMEAIRTFTAGKSWTDDIHQLRLHAKRLRYAREWMCWHQPKGADPLLRSLAELQELLGAWNDHLVAARIVARMATQRQTLVSRGEWAESWIRYAALRAEKAGPLRLEIHKIWPATRAVIDGVHAELVDR